MTRFFNEPGVPIEQPTPVPVVPVPVVIAPAPVPAVAAVDPMLAIREAGREMGREIAREIRPAPPAAPPAPPVPATPTFELAPEDGEIYQVVLWLAENQPAKHGTLPERFLAYLKGSYAYMDEWQAKNLDAEWDPEAEAHNGYFAAHPTPVDAKLIEQAKIQMLVQQGVNEAIKPYQEKITMIDDARMLESAAPSINSNVDRAIMLLVEEAAPELAQVMGGQLSREASDKLQAADPIAHTILRKYANQLEAVGMMFERTLLLDKQLPPELEHFRRQQEAVLASAPPDMQLLEDGRRFKTSLEMRRLRDECRRDKQRLDQLNAEYRSLSARELTELMASDLAALAKKEIDEFDGVARAKYGRNGAPPASAGGQPIPPATPPPDTTVRFPRPPVPPPSLSGSSEVVHTPNTPGAGVKTPGEAMVSHFFK